MKKIFIAAIVVMGFTACVDSGTKSVKGTVVDATMNAVTVRSESGDTLTFSTMEADKSGVNGMLLGSPIRVEYKGKLTGTTAATKVSTCPTYSEAVGRWVIADPLDSANVMGVELQVNGVAQSINMATLVYSSWELTEEPGIITIMGQSLGNGQTIDLSEKAVISKDADGRMTLTIGDVVYSKE